MFRKKDKRKSCRVHDRKIDREVCRQDLKRKGVPHPNKLVKDRWRDYSERKEA